MNHLPTSERPADFEDLKRTQMKNEWLDKAGLKESIRAELEKEYNSKLEEAYASFQKELKEAEKIAEEGYMEAYRVITDLKKKLDEAGIAHKIKVPDGTKMFGSPEDPLQTIMNLRLLIENQKREFQKQLEEGFQEAYEHLIEEREKNSKLEVVLYEEYEKKLADIKTYIISKIGQYLKVKWEELNEAGDEKSVALLDAWRRAVPASYMLEDAIVSPLKGEGKEISPIAGRNEVKNEKDSRIVDLQAQVKILEAKNMRLSVENARMLEHVREMQRIIAENNSKKRGSSLGGGLEVPNAYPFGDTVVGKMLSPAQDVAQQKMEDELRPEYDLKELKPVPKEKVEEMRLRREKNKKKDIGGTSTWSDFGMKYRGGWDASHVAYSPNDVVSLRRNGKLCYFVCKIPHISHTAESASPDKNAQIWINWDASHDVSDSFLFS